MNITTLDSLKKRIRNTHPRTRKAQVNTLVSLLIKGGGMLISLLLVPLTIDYLSKETYGTWLTISSIASMFAFFDIGIGSGLRNKFSEAVSNQNINLAKAYVSTSYFIFGIIQFSFILLILIVFRYIPWRLILNTEIKADQLQSVILITAVAISVKLVLDILSYVLLALQESGLVSIITFVSNLFILFGIYFLTRFTTSNLIYLSIISAISPVLVLFTSGIILYRNRLYRYKPAFTAVNSKHIKSLLSLGYQYFIIQMAIIIVNYTDNILIAHFFGPKEVTTYNVAFRYFNAINTLFIISITPYWSAFTEAFVKSDYLWMKQTYRSLQWMWLGLVVVVVLMIVGSDTIYSLWVGSRVIVPFKLNICMGLFVIISCWNSVTVAVINGVGKVRLQLFYALLSAIVNIPLAILFSKRLDMGSAGIVLATGVSLLFGSVFGALQAKKLISGSAKGIWNR